MIRLGFMRSGGNGGESAGGESASVDLLGWGGAERDYVRESCGARGAGYGLRRDRFGGGGAECG